ncbi:MAG: LuxR C-terminal-related transcriptional regulator [Bacteroidota bacterium]
MTNTNVISAGAPPSQIARCVIESFKKHPVNDAIHLLTRRENEMLNFLAKELRYKEIEDKLCISPETVRKNINNVNQKVYMQ